MIADGTLQRPACSILISPAARSFSNDERARRTVRIAAQITLLAGTGFTAFTNIVAMTVGAFDGNQYHKGVPPRRASINGSLG
jgi:hypothetical protein